MQRHFFLTLLVFVVNVSQNALWPGSHESKPRMRLSLKQAKNVKKIIDSFKFCIAFFLKNEKKKLKKDEKF